MADASATAEAVDFTKHRRVYDREPSVMRDFLENEIPFRWENGKNVCIFPSDTIPPTAWERKIDGHKSGDAWIDQCRIKSVKIHFNHSFAVKQIRGRKKIRSNNKAQQEVENMRDLRHPHVAALLGSFSHQDRLNILIFPAACCDLGDFMARISSQYKSLEREIKKGLRFSSMPISTGDFDRDDVESEAGSPASSFEGIEEDPGSGAECPSKKLQVLYSWPLRLSLHEQVEMLIKYFVCLCQALAYVHGANVRHKDIKPENVLIDRSGNVILTDFGISRRFPSGESHATNNILAGTKMYACPQFKRGIERTDSSDIFSLGCVFLEMTTLILQKTLGHFRIFRMMFDPNHGSYCEYHRCLPKVFEWIKELSVDPQSSTKQVQEVRAALPVIRQMLNQEPKLRPPSEGLWERFDFKSIPACRDCNPRHEQVWQPSPIQRDDAIAGGNRRRQSFLSVQEDNSSGGASDDATEPQGKPEVAATTSERASKIGKSDQRAKDGARSPQPSLRPSLTRKHPSATSQSHLSPSKQDRTLSPHRRALKAPTGHPLTSKPDNRRIAPPLLLSPASKQVMFDEPGMQHPSNLPQIPPLPSPTIFLNSDEPIPNLDGVTAPPLISPSKAASPSMVLAPKSHTGLRPQTKAHLQVLGDAKESQNRQNIPEVREGSEVDAGPLPPTTSELGDNPQVGIRKTQTTRSDESKTSGRSGLPLLEKIRRSSKTFARRGSSSRAASKDEFSASQEKIQIEGQLMTDNEGIPKSKTSILHAEKANPQYPAGRQNTPPATLPDLSPEEDILLFDVKDKQLRATKFKDLKCLVEKEKMKWRCHSLPSDASYFLVAENDQHLLQVRGDLNKLGWFFPWRRRFLGSFPYIYLVNFTQSSTRISITTA